mgnify:FL=1
MKQEKANPRIIAGQKVYLVYKDNRRDPMWVEVTKVGRKWAYFPYNRRFDKNTLFVDGGDFLSPGRVYLEEQDYLDKIRRSVLFGKIQNVFKWDGAGRNLDLGTLEKIAALLNLEEPESDSQPCSGT